MTQRTVDGRLSALAVATLIAISIPAGSASALPVHSRVTTAADSIAFVKGRSWAEEVLEAFALRAGTIKRPLRPRRTTGNRNRSNKPVSGPPKETPGDRGDN